MKSIRSGALHFEAKKFLPGGVSNPARSFEPYPRYIRGGKGPKIFDVDGNEYIDYCMGHGPLILGHSRREVVEALKLQLELGTLFGAPVEKELQMAKIINRYYRSMEMMSFVSTGSEAANKAASVAREHTGRKKVIRVEEAFPIAGICSAPSYIESSEEWTKNDVQAPYNDIDAIRRMLIDHKGEIAAIMLEPVITKAGLMIPEDGYIQGLRELTIENDVLLIFDEVTTGFRLSMGGAQRLLNVIPDITILGKIAGGGLPLGAFGASKEMMSKLSPFENDHRDGTFSGNPFSLTAGIETIRLLEREGHDGIDHQGERMQKGLESIINELHLDFQVTGIGSMFQLLLTDCPLQNDSEARKCDSNLFKQLFEKLLEKGIFLPPSQHATSYLSTAHGTSTDDRSLDIFVEALRELSER